MEGSAPLLSTFGCRLNAYESEAMRRFASRAGLGDAVIVNTCAVTAEAVRKGRREIRLLRRDNPEARIVVTGCAVQIDPDSFAAMEAVDHVVGNAEKMDPSTWTGLARERIGKTAVGDILSATEIADHLVDGLGSRSRAYARVQDGCDHRCTFCVIPQGRGNSRSVPADVVVDQCRRLVERGYREIVLTGVDLTSWGGELPGRPRLGNLVRHILKLVPDLPRLRLSSIDSVEADPDLMAAMAEEERLMPHLHLSLQAGDDMILKRMKRRHLRDDAVRFCAEARRLRPDMTFGADIIAGFPTESEGMFANSLRLVEDCGLTWLHVFPYSPRPGTPAARMPPVEGGVIRERSARLRAAGRAAVDRHLAAQVGREHAVLTESPRMGRTEQFAEVRFASDQPVGRIVPARIGAVDASTLVAG